MRADSAVMPAFAGIHDLEAQRLAKVVDSRTLSGHDVLRGLGVATTLFGALVPASAGAVEPGPDLAKYDCTRADDGKTVPASELIDAGFQVATVGRFGAPNVMLADPKTGARANCLIRPEQPK